MKEIDELNLEKVLMCFDRYMDAHNNKVTKAQFQKNMVEKRKSKIFNSDMHALLPQSSNYEYDIDWVYQYLFNEILKRLPGEDWKGLTG